MELPEKITVEFTRAEALVLFEFLCRSDDVGRYEFLDPAEQHVIWALEGKIESQLVEILRPDYMKLLSDARDAVRTPDDCD
jgi:hypothetical protein